MVMMMMVLLKTQTTRALAEGHKKARLGPPSWGRRGLVADPRYVPDGVRAHQGLFGVGPARAPRVSRLPLLPLLQTTVLYFLPVLAQP
jgi:hypothetical protein